MSSHEVVNKPNDMRKTNRLMNDFVFICNIYFRWKRSAKKHDNGNASVKNIRD